MNRSTFRQTAVAVVLALPLLFLPAPTSCVPDPQLCVDVYPQPDLGATVCTPCLNSPQAAARAADEGA